MAPGGGEADRMGCPEQASGLPVLQSVEEAVEWANAFIGRIDSAE